MFDSWALNNKINRIQSLAIEIYKYPHGVSPKILSEVFEVTKTMRCNLRMHNKLYAGNPKTFRNPKAVREVQKMYFSCLHKCGL